MAQDAELKLKVSLDLAFFRQQINTISAQLGGQAVQLNVQFNKKSIADQYRLLDKYFSRKTLAIKLNDSQVVAAKNNLDALSKSVATFRQAVAAPIEIKVKYKEEGKPPAGIGGTASRAITGRAAGTQALEGKSRAELQKIYSLFREANLRVGELSKGLAKSSADEIREALVPAFSDSGEEAVNGLAIGLKNGSSKVGKAAARLAADTIRVVKDVFGIASPSKVFKAIGENVGKGFEIGAIASMDRAFDELERKLQARLNKLQAMLRMAPSRRSDFPFVAMGGAPESAPIAREIDQLYAQLSQIRERRQERLSSSLAQAAGRMLPAGTSAMPVISGQDIVVKNFYKSMQDAQRMLQENFTSNSYLPRATRDLASSMQQASKGMKAITGARGPIGALPSSEMLEQRQFQSAIMQAIKTDMQNALRQQMQGLMLPAAGQTSYRTPQQKEQQRFQEAINKAAAIDAANAAKAARIEAGKTLRQTRAQMRTPALPQAGQSSFLQSSIANIGAYGRQETGGIQGIIASGKGSIFEKLKASAIAFAQNAPTVIKYLNLFRPERIGASDLPSAKEGPGQFVQRIAQQFKEGPFGPGTRPSSNRQFFAFGQGVQVPGMPLQPALPPVGGTGGSDRVTGAGQPRQRGGAIVPYAPSTRLPEGYFENAKKYSAALEAARATSAKFTASQLPLVGGLREVAGEFGFALKQVLLFGTAYKGLAFVQSLPGQILNAAKSQQQYNNALQTATQDTGTFAKELLYVDNVQRAFGLNLETTRSGFTKLYASMAPTGFDSGSIEKLFTGISAATAALQLTPDKAERVIYAFGQMASKGQIMSEELKGQLGDVLPGALAIFAKAAGMSVKEFSKAMEDGEFVGSKFRDTFAKVADELMKRFGTGAQAAGKSLQGLLNTVQGDFQRTLESFAPLANAAAQAILGPLGGSLKQLSMSAQIATGEIERTFMQLKEAQKDLGDLRAGGADAGDIKAAEQNVAALTARYKTLQQAAKDPAIAKQAQDIQSFTQELAKAGTFVMNTAKAIGNILSPILNLLGTNLTTVISLVTSFYIGFQTARLAAMALMGVLLLYRGLSALLGFGAAAQQATALAGAFNLLGVSASRAQIQVVGLRLALTALVATTVVGAVVAGIIAMAGAFATMSDRAKDAAQSSRDAAKAAVDAAASGNVAGAQMSMQGILSQSRADKKALETLRNLRSRSTVLQREGGFSVALTPEESAALQGSELTKGMIGGIKGGQRQMQLPTARQMQQIERDFGRVAQEQKVSLQEAKSAVTTAQKTAKDIGLNVPTPSVVTEKEAPDEKAARAAAKAAEDARKLADDKAKYEADLMKLSSQQALSLNEMEFDHWKNLQQAKYDFLEAGQNEWMGRELKFQRDLQAIEIRRIEAIRRARIDTVRAESEAGAKSYVATGGGGATGLLQGSTGISSGPHFDVRRADRSPITEAEARALFDSSVRRQLQMTSGYGPRRAPVPGASTFHAGIDLAGPANTPLNLAPGYSMQGAGMEGGLGYTANVRGPQGQMYKVGHLQQPKGGMPASRVRAEAKKDYASALASQEALNAQERESLATKFANIQAQQELNILIKEYTASIVPVEQQRLENSLLQNRISLISSGLFGEALETEQQISEAREKSALGVQMANAQIAQNNKLVADGILKQEEANKLNAIQEEKIKQLTSGLEAYLPLLRERLSLEQQSAEASLRGEIGRATPLGGMGLSAGFIGDAASKYEEAIGRGATADEASRFAELQNQLTLLETRNEAIKQSIYGIGNAFGEALTTGVASLVSGTASAKEVFAGFLQSVGQALSQAASQMIATYIAIGIAKMFAGLGGGGGGNPAGSGGGITDSLPGIRQYAGGLGGGGAPGSMPFAPPAFANGGIVTGPTLSLIGEGKYNEAVVPLPDGRSIPVQLGGKSARDLMGGNAPGMPASPSLNMKFETTKINGVEYVSREQLEQAMAETRRASIAGGARQGMSMTLDRIKQSPSTRSSIGIR